MHTSEHSGMRCKDVVITGLSEFGKVISNEEILSNNSWPGSWFEVIGYPVDEGSTEWAMYQMQQGRMVKNKSNFHPHSLCQKTGRIVYHGKDKDDYQERPDEWLNKRKGKGCSWQLYEPKPKPLLADAKSFDLVRFNTGLCTRITGITYDSDGNKTFGVEHFPHLRYDINGKPTNALSKDYVVYWEPNSKTCHVCNGTGFVTYDDMDGITTQSCLCGTVVVSQETAKDETQKPKPVFCETQKPLLADAKVGDLVRLETGKWHTIKAIVQQHESCLDFLVYGLDNGIHYAPNGNGMRTDSPIIVEWQPLAQEGSAEWAGQRMKLGDMVCNSVQEFVGYWSIVNGYCFHAHSGHRCSPEKFPSLVNVKTGWKLYEPEPFANVKVGDYVEYAYCLGTKHESIKHCKVTKVTDTKFYVKVSKYPVDSDYSFDFDGKNEFEKKSVMHITRILKPEEVVVDFGSFKGRVKKYHGDQVRVYDENDINFACVAIAFLDPATAELVRELVAKQEEE